jgi:hypothetical protein
MANLEKLEAIANRMLKADEKIEAKVGGSYSNDSGNGNYEIVKGFMAATNQRVLVVLNAVSLDIRKDSFTYGQVVTVTKYGNQINLVLKDETIKLYDVIDDDDLEKFFKFVTDKKTPPPKTTVAGRDMEIPPPPPKK